MEIELPPVTDRLPLHRAKIEAACHAGMELGLAGMAIAGSLAVGNADEYSDLDFKLVAFDDSFGEVGRRVAEVIASCGRVVASFPADHLGIDDLTIVLYDDLVHADFYVVKVSELAAKNEGQAAAVLWERGKSLSQEFAKPQPGRPATDVAWIERRMWTWLWYAQSKVLRGELYEALSALQWLRDEVLFPLLGLTRRARVAGARRIESLLGELQDSFVATTSVAERGTLMNALRAIATIYRSLVDPLLADLDIQPEHEARATVQNALDVGLDWRPD
jgi:hypothetical protein